jgi:hypothetical protein
MPRCTVEVVGKDGTRSSKQVEASSVFEAAGEAIQEWAKLWWWEPDNPIAVRMGDREWRVMSHRVASWLSERSGRR